MCPDKELLSVYYDGGLPSPLKEKLERHIASCPSCSAYISSCKALSAALNNGKEPHNIETAKNRVWDNLSFAMEEKGRSKKMRPRRVLWRREVRLPLPAAAACLALSFALALVLSNIRERPVEGASIAKETINAPRIIEGPPERIFQAGENFTASNMHDVIQYLDGEGDSNIVIIQLPESRNFSSYGEPSLINASDNPKNRGVR